jgi:hypothetical protein
VNAGMVLCAPHFFPALRAYRPRAASALCAVCARGLGFRVRFDAAATAAEGRGGGVLFHVRFSSSLACILSQPHLGIDDAITGDVVIKVVHPVGGFAVEVLFHNRYKVGD